MADVTFTADQVDQITLAMGYSFAADRVRMTLAQPRSEIFVTRALALLTELEAVDQALVDARSDSMAKEVGQLGLSYSQHVRHLKSEGNRILAELANITGVPVYRSKYGEMGLSTLSYW